MRPTLFQSTLSLRRATRSIRNFSVGGEISIHALLAESDSGSHLRIHRHQNFNPRSPCGERRLLCSLCRHDCGISIHALLAESDCIALSSYTLDIHFNPRSPCGERPPALRLSGASCKFQSTLSLRRATWHKGYNIAVPRISIHALLAESDSIRSIPVVPAAISIHALLAESDGRDARWLATYTEFQSTLSLRRATALPFSTTPMICISIHALLAESDHGIVHMPVLSSNFNPRSPCGERRLSASRFNFGVNISIHALLAESDSKYHQIGPIVSV